MARVFMRMKLPGYLNVNMPSEKKNQWIMDLLLLIKF